MISIDVSMKYLFSIFAIASVLVGTPVHALAQDLLQQTEPDIEDGFNSGDLAGPDEISEDEQDGLETEEREMFYRAQTSKQLEEHAKKRVQIVVTKSMKVRGYQFVQIKVDGDVVYDSPVSTAWERTAKAKTRSYFAYTPDGQFYPDAMEPKRFSNTWQVTLYHVIRFSGGVWMHATTPDHFAELGAPASGGCVRMHPSDAKNIYEIVAKYGANEAAITVLPADKVEKQIPWKNQSLQMPAALIQWRNSNSIK